MFSFFPFRRSAPTVPPFETYYPTPEAMTAEQHAFFNRLVKNWERGVTIPVDGNISYLFCLAYLLIALKDKRQAASDLSRLAEAYKHEPKISSYSARWAADCLVVAGDAPEALRRFPPINLSGRSGFMTDQLLTLKLNVGAPLAGRDVLTLFGPKVTAYAKSHLEAIAGFIDIQLKEIASRGEDLLVTWARIDGLHRLPFGAFSGVPLAEIPEQPQAYGFSYSEAIEKQCKELTRAAENTLREDEGLPRVGEGWIAETKLFYDLKAAFPDLEIVQHARLDWLGYQHLDVLIPTLQLAFEYQGPQHDRPVDFFGGEEAFLKVQQRDARKRRLCRKNGITLFEVRPGYVLVHLLDAIRQRLGSSPAKISGG